MARGLVALQIVVALLFVVACHHGALDGAKKVRAPGKVVPGKAVPAKVSCPRPDPDLRPWFPFAVSADGALLATAGPNRLCLSEPRTKRSVAAFPLCGGATLLAFDPGSRHLALVSGVDGKITVLDWRTGRVQRRLGGWHGTNIHGPGALRFSPDGKRLFATARSKDYLRIWDPVRGKALGRVGGHSDEAMAIDFTADGRSMVTAGLDGAILLRDRASGKVRRRMYRQEELFVVAFTPDGRTIAAAGQQSEVSLWATSTGKLIAKFDALDGRGIYGLAVSPDGRSLALAGYAHHVELWDVASRRLLRRFDFSKAVCPRVDFLPGGRLLVGCSEAGLRIVEPASGRVVVRLSACM